MKSFKRMLSLVLVLMMLFAVLVIPASALEPDWIAYFRNNFPTTKQSSYQARYASVIQRFLVCYPDTTELIEQSGGVDGAFGNGTTTAVKIYQADCELSADGSVGPQTWAAIANTLTDCTYTFTYGLRNVIQVQGETNQTILYYYVSDNTVGGWLHTRYY